MASATPAPDAAPERPENTYDTVAVETPARSATILRVGRREVVDCCLRSAMVQPFDPLKAMPWMNCRCRIMKVTSIGRVASSAPAISTG
ncbi:hypothetical protein GCM10009588_10120 [Microbacterium phyllosphaerae]